MEEQDLLFSGRLDTCSQVYRMLNEVESSPPDFLFSLIEVTYEKLSTSLLKMQNHMKTTNQLPYSLTGTGPAQAEVTELWAGIHGHRTHTHKHTWQKGRPYFSTELASFLGAAARAMVRGIQNRKENWSLWGLASGFLEGGHIQVLPKVWDHRFYKPLKHKNEAKSSMISAMPYFSHFNNIKNGWKLCNYSQEIDKN